MLRCWKMAIVLLAVVNLAWSAEAIQYPAQVKKDTKGRRVVATASLKAGTIVGRFDGVRYAFHEIPANEVENALRVYMGTWMVPKSDMRYLLHSCQPNCEIRPTLEVATTRDVQAGETLTYCSNLITMADFVDAPQDFFWDERWTFTCTCGHDKCQGIIDYYVIQSSLKMPMRPGSKIALSTFQGKGRGVVATERIEKGELIEQAPVIPSPDGEWVQKTRYKDYFFKWKGEDLALALGFGSLYNHSYAPNAIFYRNDDDLVIEFVALRTIEKGEEILVNYNGEPANKQGVWFRVETNSDQAVQEAR